MTLVGAISVKEWGWRRSEKETVSTTLLEKTGWKGEDEGRQ